MKPIYLLLLIMLFFAGSALAEQTTKTRGFDLKAGSFEYDLDNNVLIAAGNARLVTADGSIRADRIQAQLTKSNQDVVSAIADGSVHMVSKDTAGRTTDANAAKAAYDRAAQTVRLSGNVSVSIKDKAMAQLAKLMGDLVTVSSTGQGATILEASGGAVLTSTQGNLQAERVKVELMDDSGKLSKAVADGNVRARVIQGSDRVIIATCNHAELLSGENKAILEQNVSITVTDSSFVEPASLTGNKATVMLAPPRRIIMEGNGGQSELRVPSKSVGKKK